MARLVRNASVLLLTLASCAGEAEFVRRPSQPLFWPPDDEPTRIRYDFAYHDQADVVLHPGFFASVVNLLVGSEGDSLVHPHGIALGPDEVLWIADSGAGVVHRISLTTGEHTTIAGAPDRPLRTPIGVATTPDGRVYVTDSETGSITVLDHDGGLVRIIGEAGELGRPTGIAYDPTRQRLLITDTVGHRVLAYDPDGTFAESAGQRGDAPGQFNFPTDVAVHSDGTVAVLDSMNFRVQILDPGLSTVSEFGMAGRGPGTFASPKGIAFDRDGHLYVTDALFDNIQVFDTSGQLLLTLGEQGTDFGQFYLVSGIHIDASSRIFVADSGNAQIQVFRYISNQP